MRFHSSVRKLKELLVRNAIGRVVAGIVEAGEWLPDWHPYEPYTDYYPSSRAMGGGLDAICDLEWIIDLFGPVSRVACLAGKRTTLEIDTDDVVQMLIEFRSGPQVVLHTDMVQRVYAHKAKFIGEEGTLVWDWHRRRVSCYQARSGKWEHLEDDVVDPKERTSMDLKPGWEWVEPMYLEDSRVFFARAERHDCSTDSLLEGIKNLKLILEALECSNQSRVWSNPEFR
jgi:predicted dehydrogenase